MDMPTCDRREEAPGRRRRGCMQWLELKPLLYYKIAHININHLLHKKNFISELIGINNISIFAVTETWLSENISDGEISIPHYRVFRRDRTDRRGGGVVFISTKPSTSKSWYNCKILRLKCSG